MFTSRVVKRIDHSHRALEWTVNVTNVAIMPAVLDRYNSGLGTLLQFEQEHQPSRYDKAVIANQLVTTDRDNLELLVPVILSRDPIFDSILNSNSHHHRTYARTILHIVSILSSKTDRRRIIKEFNVTPFELLMGGWGRVRCEGITHIEILDAIHEFCQSRPSGGRQRVPAIARILFDRIYLWGERADILRVCYGYLTNDEFKDLSDDDRSDQVGPELYSFSRMKKHKVPIAAYTWCRSHFMEGHAAECRKVIESGMKVFQGLGFPRPIAAIVVEYSG